MKRIAFFLIFLILGFFLLGCLERAPTPAEAFDASKVVIHVTEKSPGRILVLDVEKKQLAVDDAGSKRLVSLSFVEILGWISDLNQTGFFNSSETYSACKDCPVYLIYVKSQNLEKNISVFGVRIAGSAATLVARLKARLGFGECKTDSDCAPVGCSGQFCQARTVPSIISTCQFKQEFACYKPDGCLCLTGKCAWSDAIVACVENTVAKPERIPQEIAQTLCVRACFDRLQSGADLRLGPCISDSIAPGWACDVVHEPRQPIDISEPYLCPSLAKGYGYSVVELDENCREINAR